MICSDFQACPSGGIDIGSERRVLEIGAFGGLHIYESDAVGAQHIKIHKSIMGRDVGTPDDIAGSIDRL